MKALILFSDCSRGRYIPQHFAKEIKRKFVSNISDNDWNILENPDHEFYWDVWDDVLMNSVINFDGNVYRLYQDGDLWLYCEGLMTEQEINEFFGEW